MAVPGASMEARVAYHADIDRACDADCQLSQYWINLLKRSLPLVVRFTSVSSLNSTASWKKRYI